MLVIPAQALFSSPVIASAFLLLSLIAGILGRDTRIGFWGFLFVSMIFTPLVSLIFMFFSKPAKEKTLK